MRLAETKSDLAPGAWSVSPWQDDIIHAPPAPTCRRHLGTVRGPSQFSGDIAQRLLNRHRTFIFTLILWPLYKTQEKKKQGL